MTRAPPLCSKAFTPSQSIIAGTTSPWSFSRRSWLEGHVHVRTAAGRERRPAAAKMIRPCFSSSSLFPCSRDRCHDSPSIKASLPLLRLAIQQPCGVLHCGHQISPPSSFRSLKHSNTLVYAQPGSCCKPCQVHCSPSNFPIFHTPHYTQPAHCCDPLPFFLWFMSHGPFMNTKHVSTLRECMTADINHITLDFNCPGRSIYQWTMLCLSTHPWIP